MELMEEEDDRNACNLVIQYWAEIVIFISLLLITLWGGFLVISTLLLIFYLFYYRIAKACTCLGPCYTCCGIFISILTTLLIYFLVDTSSTEGPSHFQIMLDFSIIALFWFFFSVLMIDLFICIPLAVYDTFVSNLSFWDVYNIFKLICSIIAGLALSTACIIYGRASPEIVLLDIRMKNLPENLVGFKIVALADIHVGKAVGSKNLEEIIPMINEIEPDLIALVGDVIDAPYDK